MARSTMMRNCPVKIGIGRKTRISSGAFARPDGTARLTKLISAINSLPPSRAASFSSHGKSGATEAAHRIQWQKGQAQKAWPFFQNLQMWGDTVPEDTLLLDNTGPEILTISGSNQVQPSHTANSDHFGRLKGRADKARAFFLHSVCSRNLYWLCPQLLLVKRQLR